MAAHSKLLSKILDELRKKELKKFRWYLKQQVLKGCPPIPAGRLENADIQKVVDLMVQHYSDVAVKITEEILKNLNRNDLVEDLQAGVQAETRSTDSETGGTAGASGPIETGIKEYKANVMVKRERILDEKYTKILLNEGYTEVFLNHGGTDNELRQIEAACRKPRTPIKCDDIFDKGIKTVMTTGVAGIGKTYLVNKFTLDWAEEKTNQDIHLTVLLQFRELNDLKAEMFCFVDLIAECTKGIRKEVLTEVFTELQNSNNLNVKTNKYRVLFIFDGLDECRLPLDFVNKKKCTTNVTELTSVDRLLTNLIKGNLLPSALIWITSRPAAANKIPSEYVDMVTEAQGFTDPQKEEFFKKRFSDDVELASRIISHIKASRSLHIMCHIPVFCSISATVLEKMLTDKSDQDRELPKTLTEMYIRLLMFQSIRGNKYHEDQVPSTTYQDWNTKTSKIILSLAKLAFEQLEEGNLFFKEKDLEKSGIDVEAASLWSGVFTQILKKEDDSVKVFSFIHLSIQEFLAALHVFLAFNNKDVDLLEPSWFYRVLLKQPFYNGAVNT